MAWHSRALEKASAASPGAVEGGEGDDAPTEVEVVWREVAGEPMKFKIKLKKTSPLDVLKRQVLKQTKINALQQNLSAKLDKGKKSFPLTDGMPVLAQLEKIANGESLLAVTIRVKADPIDTERLMRRQNTNLKHFITYDAWKASDEALAKARVEATKRQRHDARTAAGVRREACDVAFTKWEKGVSKTKAKGFAAGAKVQLLKTMTLPLFAPGDAPTAMERPRTVASTDELTIVRRGGVKAKGEGEGGTEEAKGGDGDGGDPDETYGDDDFELDGTGGGNGDGDGGDGSGKENQRARNPHGKLAIAKMRHHKDPNWYIVATVDGWHMEVMAMDLVRPRKLPMKDMFVDGESVRQCVCACARVCASVLGDRTRVTSCIRMPRYIAYIARLAHSRLLPTHALIPCRRRGATCGGDIGRA